MSEAEEIYERARQLPALARAEVLDFIGYLESKLARESEPRAKKLPDPISVGQILGDFRLDRQSIYGDDER